MERDDPDSARGLSLGNSARHREAAGSPAAGQVRGLMWLGQLSALGKARAGSVLCSVLAL